MIVICYVSDRSIFSREDGIIDKLKQALVERYVTKDLGVPSQFLALSLN